MHEDALDVYREGIEVMQARPDVFLRELPILRSNLAMSLLELGRAEEARDLLLQVVSAHREIDGGRGVHLGISLSNLAMAESRPGHHEAARAAALEAVGIVEGQYGGRRSAVDGRCTNLARFAVGAAPAIDRKSFIGSPLRARPSTGSHPGPGRGLQVPPWQGPVSKAPTANWARFALHRPRGRRLERGGCTVARAPGGRRGTLAGGRTSGGRAGPGSMAVGVRSCRPWAATAPCDLRRALAVGSPAKGRPGIRLDRMLGIR